MDVGALVGVGRAGGWRGRGRGWKEGRAGREEKEGVKESVKLRQVDWKTAFRFSISCIEWNLSKSAFLSSCCVF